MYTKLFASITESSLWSEPKEVRLLFVSMLARSDQNGFVDAAIPGLARLANLTLEETEAALKVLLSPDKYSKNPGNDGCRVTPVPGGFAIINYEDYRSRRNDDDRKEYMREYMKQYRSGKQCKQPVNNVSRSKPPLAQAEAEAEADTEQITIKKKGDSAKSPFLQNPEFVEVAAAFRKARTAKHGAVSEEVVEAWYYDLNRFPVVEAIEILRFSTACEAKKPITNGDHKAKPPPERNGKPKTKTDEVNEIIKRTFANGK